MLMIRRKKMQKNNIIKRLYFKFVLFISYLSVLSYSLVGFVLFLQIILYKSDYTETALSIEILKILFLILIVYNIYKLIKIYSNENKIKRKYYFISILIILPFLILFGAFILGIIVQLNTNITELEDIENISKYSNYSKDELNMGCFFELCGNVPEASLLEFLVYHDSYYDKLYCECYDIYGSVLATIEIK